jgi:CheY-like chemotaxis protein
MHDKKSGTQNGTNRYIMVVDSKAQELLSMSLLLQRFDYQVWSANSTAQALEMVAVAVPALVIADLCLPGMSGLDLLHLLKQDPRTSSVPVVFLIPAGDDAAMKQCLEEGAFGCIYKPIQAEDLYRTVQASIELSPRKNIRIKTQLAVSVNNVPLRCIEGECASILSEYGMYVPMPKPYQKNEQLTVHIKINNRSVSAKAAVLYRHTYGEGPFKEPGMGLKFIGMASEDKDIIRQFIREETTKSVKP